MVIKKRKVYTNKERAIVLNKGRNVSERSHETSKEVDGEITVLELLQRNSSIQVTKNTRATAFKNSLDFGKRL